MNPKDFVHKLLKPDGSVVDYPPAGKAYTREELQKAVEGYIGVVKLLEGYIMIINEEGQRKGLPINDKATELFRADPFRRLFLSDHIVGNALVCRSRGKHIV